MMLIEKYNIAWIKAFDEIKVELQSALNNLEYHIEYIGSTSVPDLDSKPIIDIDIIYYTESELDKIKVRLERIGYYHNENQGIEGREVFKRKGCIKNEVLDSIKHHLYVCPNNSEALKRHILFRDVLRKNEFARVEYQRIKYDLAEKAKQNKKVYAELKELNVNDFIDELIGLRK